MKKLITALFIGTMLIACGPLKRAKINREKKKLETLIQKYKVDSVLTSDTITITKFDTIRIPGETVDTVRVLDKVDTVILETERQKTVLIRQFDTFRIHNTVKQFDTVFVWKDSIIYKEKIKTVDISEEKPNSLKVSGLWVIFILGCLILFIFYIYLGLTR